MDRNKYIDDYGLQIDPLFDNVDALEAEIAELKADFQRSITAQPKQIKIDAIQEMMEYISSQYPKIKNLSMYTKSDILDYVDKHLEKSDG